MKKVLYLFIILIFFFGCSKKIESSNNLTEEVKVDLVDQTSPKFINIPATRSITFTSYDEDGVASEIIVRGSKPEDSTSAIYEFQHNRIPMMSGIFRKTKNEIYLEYPDYIADTSEPEEISKWLNILFPDKKDSILTWDSECINIEKQKLGAYVINGVSFIDDERSKTLEKYTINGYDVICTQIYRTISEETYFFENPDFSSKKIFITKNPLADYGYSQERKIFNQKLKFLNKELSMPAVEGIQLQTRGRYVSKEKPDERWYYVRIDNLTDSKYGWINGNAISVADTNEISKKRFASLIGKLEEAGVVQIENADIDNLPTELNCFDIEPDAGFYLFYDDNNIWLVIGYLGIYTTLPRSCLIIDTDGYMKFKYNQYDMLFITGGINQFFRDFKNDGENTYDDPDRTEGFHNRNIKSITASSFFEETIKGQIIKYTPDNLGKAFEEGCKCHPYWWNYSHIPWVEGVDGNGIGEFITVEFTEPVIELELINGYTDINNMKLYKENARVKTFELEDLDNNITKSISFDDYVYFNEVILEKPTSRIRLTIQEVYPGTKYQDTCFSSILATSYKRNNADKKENANTFKKIYKRSIEVSPEEFYRVQTEVDL